MFKDKKLFRAAKNPKNMEKKTKGFGYYKESGPLRNLQKRIFRNKKNKGFNVSSDRHGINQEICHLVEEFGELASAHRGGNRIAVVDSVIDIIVFSLGILEILRVDGDLEIQKVLNDIEARKYIVNKDGSCRRTK